MLSRKLQFEPKREIKSISVQKIHFDEYLTEIPIKLARVPNMEKSSLQPEHFEMCP